MVERQMRAFRQLVAAGYSKEGAAALLGNAIQESGPDLVSGYQKNTDHGSQGIFQWRFSRLHELNKFCEERGLHSGTLDAQIKFAIYELGKDYPRLDRELRQGGDVADLTSTVCWEYERPPKVQARSIGGLNAPRKFCFPLSSKPMPGAALLPGPVPYPRQ